MDYIAAWFSRRYDSIYTCNDWYSLIFHILMVFIVSLGLIGAVRRRNRILTILMSGLFLLFIGDPVRILGLILFVHQPSPSQPFIEYVEAQRPWVLLGKADRNIIKPIGFVITIIAALIWAGYGRGQKVQALSDVETEAE